MLIYLKNKDNIKFITILFVALVCVVSSSTIQHSSTAIMMTTGLGHFFLAHKYHAKTGKVNKNYLIIVISISIFFISLYNSKIFPLETSMLFTSTLVKYYFVFHFLYDEHYLDNGKNNLKSWVKYISILIVYSGFLLSELAYSASSQKWTIFSIALALSLIVFIYSKGKKDINLKAIYVLAIIFCSIGLYVGIDRFDPFHFIVIMHFFSWYIKYFYSKAEESKESFLSFLGEVFWVNIIIVSLFLIYLIHYNFNTMKIGSIPSYLFSQPYFYMWAAIHYAVTFRKTDINNWLPARN